MIDWIVGIAALAVVIWTIVHQIKVSKSGKSSCGSCGGCTQKDNCYKKAEN